MRAAGLVLDFAIGVLLATAVLVGIDQCRNERAYERCQRVDTYDCETDYRGTKVVTRCNWRCLAERGP